MGGEMREMETALLCLKCGNGHHKERLLNGFDQVS